MTNDAGDKYQADPEKVATLVEELKGNMQELKGYSAGPGSCRDCINVSITLNDGGRGQVISFAEGASDTPQLALDLSSEVQGLIAAAQK